MHIKKSNNRAIAMVLTIAMLLSMLGQVAMAAPIAPDVISQSYVCGMTEHTHGPECYEDQGYEYQCFKELRKTEGQGKPKTWNIIHEHNEFCYLDGALICPLKERTAHIHGESCYEIPQLPAVDDSADVSTDIDEAGDGTDAGIDTQMMVAEPVLTCTLQDTSELTVHNHTEEKCLPAEHKVGLICAVPEHTHSSSCLPKVEEPKETATPEPTPIPTPTPTPVVESKEPVPSHTVTPTHTIPPTATPTETLLPTFEPTPSLDVDITEPPAIGSDEPVVGSDEPVIESEEPSDNPAEESPSDEPAEEEPGEDEDLIAPQVTSVMFAPQVQNTVVATGLSGSFTFEVQPKEAYDAVVMPTVPIVTIKGTGLASFPGISFTAPGTYYFTISEQAGSSSAYRYDSRTYTLTVNVAEAGDKLIAVGEYKLDSESAEARSDYAAFINTYTIVSGWSSQTKRQAQTLMDKMTLEEKVGQLFLIHYPGDGSGTVSQATTLINKYHPGGYLVFAAMFQNGTTESVQQKIADTQAASKIPLLFTVDEEGGISGSGTRVVRVSQYPQYGHDPFKSPQELKAAGGLSAVASDAIDKAAFLKNLGLNVNHAPVADISGPSGYMYGRTWGGDGVENAKYVETLVRASENAGMATTLKHFPGYGGTSSNTHNGFAVNNLAWEDFLYNDLLPFQAGMAAGSHAVMVTHNTINCLDSNNPSSLSPAVYNMLRNEMHFDGVAMTDDLNMSAITNFVGNGQASLRALQAGADMAMTGSPDADIPVALAAAKNGALSLADIEAKCLRILCWKIEMGLIDENDIPIDPSDYEASYSNGYDKERYGTFEEMWAIAESDNRAGTVKLLKNVEFETTQDVPRGKNITLNLCGQSLDFAGQENAFTVSGTFSIKDTQGRINETTYSGPTSSTGYFSATKTLDYVSTTNGTIKHADFSGLGCLAGNSSSSLVYVDGGSFTLTNGRLENTSGSAVESRTNSSSRVTIAGGAITGCGDSGVRMSGGTFTMSSGYIAGNKSKTNGGGVSLSNMSTMSARGVIAHNAAEFDGGGIYAYGTNTNINGTITGNSAQNNGGGVAVTDGNIVGAPTIIYNSCAVNGGGIYQNGENITLSGGQVSNNAALSGGGIYASNAVVDISGAFERNEATNGGGMYSNNSTVNISGSIKNNEAENGGGVYATGGNVTITGAIAQNKARGNGGGIYSDNSNITVSKVVTSDTGPNIVKSRGSVSSNSATNGGGIFQTGTNATISVDGEISNNTASNVGGGIASGYGGANTKSLKLERFALIQNNAAGSYAGGIYANAKDITISSTRNLISEDTSTAPKIKNNHTNGKNDNLYLPNGKMIETIGTNAATITTFIHAEIWVNTESTASVIPVAFANATTLPGYATDVFKPDREEYATTAENGRVVFSTSEDVSIPVYVIVDGIPYHVGTVNSVYSATAGNGSIEKFINLSDFSASLKDYQFNEATYSGEMKFGFQIGNGSITVPSTPITSHQDGWHITTPITTGFDNIKLYYLPNSAAPGAYSIETMTEENSFWSVTIRDTYWSVNEDAEDVSSVSYVPAGKMAVYSLPIREGVWSWKVSEHNEADFTINIEEIGGVVKVSVTNIHAPVVITSANEGDVKYTIQHFARITSVVLNSSAANNGLEVIDTSGGNLPKNGVTPNIKYINLDSNGAPATATTLKRIYVDGTCLYSATPTLSQADRLYADKNYELTELWVLKNGRNAESEDVNDWDIYKKSELGIDDMHDLHLTTSPDKAVPNETICIEDGATIRFVYDQRKNTTTTPVSFFDYDITDGYIYKRIDFAESNRENTTNQFNTPYQRYVKTAQQGINNPSNYSGTGAHLAFGNANTASGWADEMTNGGYINKFNRDANKVVLGYKGCYFGIVTGLNEDGTLRYKSGITAPKLFNVGEAIGKTPISGHSLEFSQSGDVYTLEAVTGTNATQLSTFRHPHEKYQSIWTNDFWPRILLQPGVRMDMI